MYEECVIGLLQNDCKHLYANWDINSIAIQRSLIHVRFMFPGLWPLLMTVSGLEETICTGHLKLKFFLYYFQMVFHMMFIYLRGKGLNLALKKLNFLGLAQIKIFVFFQKWNKNSSYHHHILILLTIIQKEANISSTL